MSSGKTSLSHPQRLCPSSRCEAGNILLGIVGSDGSITFLGQRLEIDANFVEIAKSGRPPEQRFRFSSPCLKPGCEKWTGSGCGVAEILNANASGLPASAAQQSLPRCSIRSECRWHGEYGNSICFACSWVITERGASAELGEAKLDSLSREEKRNG
jgi:hypothetical protein